MRRSKVYLGLAVVLAFFAGVAAGAEAEPPRGFALEPDLAYRASRINPVSYDVDFSVVVTAPYHTKVLKVWLPLPPSDCVQEVTDRRLSTFPQQVEPQISREPIYDNQFAYFEFHEPQGGQVIRHRFRAKVWELRWKLDPARVTAVERWPEGFQPYLRPQVMPAQDARFQTVLREILPRRQGPAQDLIAVMGWIDRHLSYDHVDASLRADAQHAFTRRRGHCSDYHGLCATMGRSLGCPTRVVYGLNLFPKNSPSHCKLEAFLPPYGWVSFDLSETQKMITKIKRDETLDDQKKEQLAHGAWQRLLGGFRDNTWLLVTKGTDYELTPPASKPVCVVRTIYAEADGVALPDPDPANIEKREFAWMTVHRYESDKPVTYPFKDLRSLECEEYDGVYGKGTKRLIVATGSPGELGLLKVLAETFANEENVTVCWKKAGSGKSLELLRERKVDAIMVHAPEAEKKAVEEGWARRRALIGSNEFFIVGPADDPAGIRTAKTACEVYQKIASSRARFLSRGDNSGTHKREMAIWKKAGILPKGDWYIATGDFMMASLRRANAENGYFMTDSSTWIVECKNLPNLKLLFRGDRLLLNVYHALCQPEGETPGASIAAEFVDFLGSDETQQILRNYGTDQYGEGLYNDASYARQCEQHSR